MVILPKTTRTRNPAIVVYTSTKSYKMFWTHTNDTSLFLQSFYLAPIQFSQEALAPYSCCTKHRIRRQQHYLFSGTKLVSPPTMIRILLWTVSALNQPQWTTPSLQLRNHRPTPTHRFFTKADTCYSPPSDLQKKISWKWIASMTLSLSPPTTLYCYPLLECCSHLTNTRCGPTMPQMITGEKGNAMGHSPTQWSSSNVHSFANNNNNYFYSLFFQSFF